MCSIDLEMIVTYNPCHVHGSDTLQQAAEVFEQFNVFHVPVIDDSRRLTGVITDSELLRAVTEHRAAAAAKGVSWGLNFPQVKDFMIRRVITADANDTVALVLERMLSAGVHSLPYVEKGMLAGLITSADVLREFAYCDTELAHSPVTLFVDEVLEPVEPHATLSDVKAHLDALAATHALVMQSDCPLGIVSHRDVRRAQTRLALAIDGEDAEPEPTASALVTKSPVALPGTTLGEAAALMVESQVSALTVMNGLRRVVGILREDRLLQEFASELASKVTARVASRF